jgi:hypothetical protein
MHHLTLQGCSPRESRLDVPLFQLIWNTGDLERMNDFSMNNIARFEP